MYTTAATATATETQKNAHMASELACELGYQ